MSSLNRPLSGTPIIFDLAREIETAQAARPPQPTGRTARTLVKDGSLRVTMILLDAGAEIAEHSAEGPITVHVLQGAVHMHIEGQDHRIGAGQLLTTSAGVRHTVAADVDSVFLLTVSLPA